jgi:hypothetical protein
MQEPPNNTPRIVEVQNPGSGHHVVMVRMPTLLASKWPDKPWGTPLDSIGLSLKDLSRFEGYTLTGVERVPESADLLWIFQKLDGPVWATRSKGIESLTPPKYRRQVETTRTEREVPSGAEPDIPTGTLIQSEVKDRPNSGVAVKTTTTEVIDTTADPLVGEEYGDIVTRSVEEKLVDEGTDADTGIDVVSSVVESLGDGKAIKQTKRVKGGLWPNPYESDVSLDPPNIPSKLRRFLKRLTTKSKVAAIPENPTLGAGEVGLGFKKETPDRVEKTVVSESLDLSGAPDEVVVDQKPFVTITATTKTASTSALPLTGNGSSRIIYDNGTAKVWDNTAEVAQARDGLKAVETSAQQWGRIVSTTNYTTSSTAPAGGSVRIIFDDGAVKIYESESTAATPSGSSIDIDPNSWGSITWNGTYSATTSGDKSRQVWSNGSTAIFLNENATLTIEQGTFVSGKETNPVYVTTSTSHYSATPLSAAGNNSSRLIFSLKDKRVFLNTETTAVAGLGLTYYSVINATRPSVLKFIDVEPIERKPDKDGDPVRDKFCIRAEIEEGFTGLFEAKIEESFSTDPNAASNFDIKPFEPRRIDYNGLLYSIAIGETLHGDIVLNDAVGSNDPEYPSGTSLPLSFREFKATDPPDVPTGFVPYAIQVDPYMDGFIIKKISVKFKPDAT